MITELRLENWKSFGEATLHIDPLSVLIGTNASGKSNVVDALVFLRNLVSNGSLVTAVDSVRGGEDWIARNSCSQFLLTLRVENERLGCFEYHLSCEFLDQENCVMEEKLISFVRDTEGEVHERLIKQAKNKSKKEDAVSRFHLLNLLSFMGRDKELRPDEALIQNLFDKIEKIFILSPDPSEMARFSDLSNKLKFDASNLAGALAGLSPESQQEIENVMSGYASRLPERDIKRVYAEKVGKLAKDAMLYCDECWSDSGEVFTVDARAMSDGTLRFLAILTALLTLEEGSLLVIDEVDNGLHPSRANLLLEALRDIGKQRKIDVLVTTHNPALLDALGIEAVPFVTVAHRDTESGDSKLTLLEDIEQLPKLLAQGTVGKLSSRGLIEKSLESPHE